MEGLEYLFLRIGRNMMDMLESQVYGGNTYVEYGSDNSEAHLTAELPGVRPSDLRVFVSRAGFRVVASDGGETVYSRFFKTKPVQTNNARVSFLNGVLEVRAPLSRGFF